MGLNGEIIHDMETAESQAGTINKSGLPHHASFYFAAGNRIFMDDVLLIQSSAKPAEPNGMSPAHLIFYWHCWNQRFSNELALGIHLGLSKFSRRRFPDHSAVAHLKISCRFPGMIFYFIR
jgi:hypothetical protein